MELVTIILFATIFLVFIVYTVLFVLRSVFITKREKNNLVFLVVILPFLGSLLAILYIKLKQSAGKTI